MIGKVLGLAVAAAALAAAATTVAAPPVNGRFDYQIGGSYRPVAGVRIVDRDRASTPVKGVYSICYINAFQTQPEQDTWWKRHHPGLLLRDTSGKVVEDKGWPGEYLLNTGTAKRRHALARIEDRWITGCARKGFQAVEPDNLDSYSRSHGRLSVADNYAFAHRLVMHAHARGLAVAQKNDAAHVKRGHSRAHFDFALAEECQVYSECGHYLKVYGDHVIEIEYTDNGRSAYRTACRDRGSRISVILRDRDVVAKGRKGYVYRAC